jgi:SAM-dependent methyltransferase
VGNRTSGGVLPSLTQRERGFYDAKKGAFFLARRWITRAKGEFSRVGDVHDYYDPKGKVALDYGCGQGQFTFRLLGRGARSVIGFDVSVAQVNEARELAEEAGVHDAVHFLVTDAHQTGFDDASFDLIVGRSILHHLNLSEALEELRRILKAGGSAVFVEPLRHNPLLRVGRAMTPWARTPDEHPLTVQDWALCGSFFAGFQHFERELITVPVMPLNLVLPRSWQKALARRLAPVDDRLLERFPFLRRYARVSILILE